MSNFEHVGGTQVWDRISRPFKVCPPACLAFETMALLLESWTSTSDLSAFRTSAIVSTPLGVAWGPLQARANAARPSSYVLMDQKNRLVWAHFLSQSSC